MFDVSAYRLTIIAAVVVLVLSAGVLTALNGAAQTTAYLAFLGPTLVALLAVLRGEQNAKQVDTNHAETTAALGKLVDDNVALGHALQQIKGSDMSVSDAALAAAEVMKTPPKSTDEGK